MVEELERRSYKGGGLLSLGWVVCDTPWCNVARFACLDQEMS